jgi:hypothetical protein
MRTTTLDTPRGTPLSAVVVAAAIGGLAVAFALDRPQAAALPLAALVLVGAVAYRSLLAWQTILAAITLVILFVPIRRYTMPGNLPFELEPYRLMVALVMLGWLASLLVDPRIAFRKTGFDRPLVLITATSVGSLLANSDRLATADDEVVKKLTFFASFLLVTYLVVSVVRSEGQVQALVSVLVAGGAAVAAFALLEARSGYNLFDHLGELVPVLGLNEGAEVPVRGARLRVYASAQHPIALGALLVMLVPFAVCLARVRRIWWVAVALLALGTFSTVSRTSVVMLVVVAIVFLWLRPREVKKLWPALIPLVLAIHLTLPGTLGSLREAFFPAGGIVAEQQSLPGYRGSGRLADVSPALEQYGRHPLLGDGFGTRIIDVNAFILDNQWLGTLLEVGALGAFAWLWLFLASVRRFGGEARRDVSQRGWLLGAFAAAVAAYAVGMFFYDAFAFVQVTFLLFILLGLGAALLQMRPVGEVRPARAPTPDGDRALP